MTPNRVFRIAVTAGVAGSLLVGLPAHADTDEDGLLGVPPASTTPDIAPVLQIVPNVSSIIKRVEDLEGETRRESSTEAERFTLKGDVFFDVDKASLTSDAEEKLADIVEELAGVEIESIEVGGHTDTVDSHDHNDKLSEDRAKTVADFLREDLDDVDITAKGYGKRQLAAPEEGNPEEVEEARAKNRRVEIDVKFLEESP